MSRGCGGTWAAREGARRHAGGTVAAVLARMVSGWNTRAFTSTALPVSSVTPSTEATEVYFSIRTYWPNSAGSATRQLKAI